MDDVEPDPGGFGGQRRRLFGGQVGDDDAVHADLGGGFRERRQAELEHRVVVREEHDGGSYVGAQRLHQLEHADHRRAAGERTLGGPLDDGSVGERIGKGHTQLDDIGAATLGLSHESARGFERRIASREVGHQRTLTTRPQPRKRRVESTHGALRPSALATTWTSLSPRPDRPTTIAFVRGNVFASWTA